MKILVIILSLLVLLYSCNNDVNKVDNSKQVFNSEDKLSYNQTDIDSNLIEISYLDIDEIITDSNKVKSKPRFNSISAICKSFRPKVDVFFINPSKDTLLECKGGTKVYFPANILELPYLKGRDTNVQIKIQEFYSNTDFISKNLSTRSDSLLLETAGMFYVEALIDNKPLKLKNEESYVIYVPNNKGLDSMETFYGTFKNDEVNWINQDQVLENDFLKNDSIIDSTKFYKCFVELPEFNKRGLDNVSRSWTMANSEQYLWQYFIDDFNRDTSESNLRMNYCNDNFEALFKLIVDKKGEFKFIVIDSTTNRQMNHEIKYFLENIPPIKANNMMGTGGVTIYYSMNFGTSFKFHKPYYFAYLKEKYNQYKEDGLERIDKREIEYFVLASTKLGWINCDRFIGWNRKKVKVYIQNKELADVKVYMMTSGVNGLLNGVNSEVNRFVFDGIPNNNDVRLVAVGFLNGKAKMKMLEANTISGNIVLADFEPFSIKKFDNYINGYN